MSERKYIFVTGGVVSGLGKGIASASIGSLLKESGFKISMMKIDPYLNVDPGTQRPGEHGEVFVTEDGAETDLDLGHYERFTDEPTRKLSNTTTGQVYQTVIEKERRGDYQGQTVQIIPHITNEIQRRIILLGEKTDADIVICEIGGTIGDIESLPFIEAIRQMSIKLGKENCCYVHLTLIPFIESSGETKTKPTQHSVRDLQGLGITPDFLICRTKHPLKEEHLQKISLYCNVPQDCVIQGYDVKNIYEVPYCFFKQKIHSKIKKRLGLLGKKEIKKTNWENFINNKEYKGEVKIAIVGKYVDCQDAYKSIDEALFHATNHLKLKLVLSKVDSEDVENFGWRESLTPYNFDGVLVPGGFGQRGFNGKVITAGWARDHKVPFFGICYGLHAAVISFARDILKLEDVNSTESKPSTLNPVIDLMEEQKTISDMGGTMRLGNYECFLDKKEESIARKVYKKQTIVERHRHRYEFNNNYFADFANKGMISSGKNLKTNLVEIMELNHKIPHPFYIGVQFHPEFNSRPFRPHPLFVEFVKVSFEHKKKTIG